MNIISIKMTYGSAALLVKWLDMPESEMFGKGNLDPHEIGVLKNIRDIIKLKMDTKEKLPEIHTGGAGD